MLAEVFIVPQLWCKIIVFPVLILYFVVHERKMLDYLHECIAYHKSSRVTIYFVHNFQVDARSGFHFMTHLFVIE